MLEYSILHQKAESYKFPKISRAPVDIQFAIYRATLTDLEEYLDTEDLRKLTSTSMGIIKEDILEIIKGFRLIKSKFPVGKVKSMDGILENLRLARDNLQVADGFFKQDKLDQSKSQKFFKECRLARKSIAESLRWFGS